MEKEYSENERRFLDAFKTLQQAYAFRPKSGVYPGSYVDEKESTYIDDRGIQKPIRRPIPHDEQALDYKCWKLYVYYRDLLFPS